MDIPTWKNRLGDLQLGDIYLFQQVGSTNQEALRLAGQGTRNFSLVAADSQTAGRGRGDSTWISVAGKALAFSWIFYPDPGLITSDNLGKLSGLGALAVAETLEDRYQLQSRIKWPNDVLVEGKKVCGVLVDLSWIGPKLEYGVLGIGVNIHPGSVPDDGELAFPAAYLEEFTKYKISRLELLVQVLKTLLKWYQEISSERFVAAWERRLAFVNQEVLLQSGDHVLDQGIIQGLSEDGCLLLLSESGDLRSYQTGQLQLRPVDRI